MSGSKDWYASTTIWGGILAAASPFIGPILAHFGVSLTSDDMTALAAALAGIGGVIAVIGRMRATTTIQAPPK